MGESEGSGSLPNSNSAKANDTLTRIVVVEKLSDWEEEFPRLQVVELNDYLSNPLYFKAKNLKVINLCRTYKYLGKGYYCSLLAEARSHKILPSVKALRNISNRSYYNVDTDELNQELHKVFSKKKQNNVTKEIYIFFGMTDFEPLKELASQIFQTMRCPLMKVEFKQAEGWQIGKISLVNIKSIPQDKKPLFILALAEYSGKRWIPAKTKTIPKYEIAILYDPNEAMPPSEKPALLNFIKAGKQLDVSVDLITKKDFPKIAEYDALFIRETTAIEHHTFLFSNRAQKEGLVVIDDPESILRCTNKVFLAELLDLNKIPTPKTIILKKDEQVAIEKLLSYPVVLKIPEGSFSLGVFKANNKNEFEAISKDLFKKSEIILAQEFVYTPYDWRIGVLNKKPLFASQYFMYKEHWQIYDHSVKDDNNYGNFKTVAIEEAPPAIVSTALKAANLVGDGLYGVDIKDTEKGPCVIEINDNPNIDQGVEDFYLKDKLYKIIINDFIERIEIGRKLLLN